MEHASTYGEFDFAAFTQAHQRALAAMYGDAFAYWYAYAAGHSLSNPVRYAEERCANGNISIFARRDDPRKPEQSTNTPRPNIESAQVDDVEAARLRIHEAVYVEYRARGFDLDSSLAYSDTVASEYRRP